MTVHRTVLRLAGFAAVSALAMTACSSNVTDAEPGSSSSESVSASGASTTTVTTTESSTPTSTVDVPAGFFGSGCATYMQKVPSGPGSLLGMAADPVATALANSPQLTTFAGALSGKLNPDVNFVDTLNKNPYTVFVPTDDAFARLDPALIDKFKSDASQLTSVLNYHVVAGDLDPAAVVGDHKTPQGQSLTVSGSGDDLRVNNANVICGGIKTTNATVYLIDTVLIPPPPAPSSSPASPTAGAETTATPTS